MPTIADRVLVKVDRAEEHIDTLKEAVRKDMARYFGNLPAEIHPEHEGSPAELQITFPVTLPIGFGRHAAIIGDIVHNLRSTLDHLAWELVKANRGEPNEHTGFPIRATRPGTDRNGGSLPPRIVTANGGVDATALEVIKKVQPYWICPEDPESTDLWHLHRLDIEDKHHGLVTAPIHFDQVNLVATSLDPIPGILQRDRMTDDGAEFTFVPNRFDVNVNGKVTFVVALGEGLPGEHSPVVTKMRMLLALVRDDICPSLFRFL